MGLVGGTGVIVAGSCNSFVTETVIDRTDLNKGLESKQIYTVKGEGVKLFLGGK